MKSDGSLDDFVEPFKNAALQLCGDRDLSEVIYVHSPIGFIRYYIRVIASYDPAKLFHHLDRVLQSVVTGSHTQKPWSRSALRLHAESLQSLVNLDIKFFPLQDEPLVEVLHLNRSHLPSERGPFAIRLEASGMDHIHGRYFPEQSTEYKSPCYTHKDGYKIIRIQRSLLLPSSNPPETSSPSLFPPSVGESPNATDNTSGPHNKEDDANEKVGSSLPSESNFPASSANNSISLYVWYISNPSLNQLYFTCSTIGETELLHIVVRIAVHIAVHHFHTVFALFFRPHSASAEWDLPPLLSIDPNPLPPLAGWRPINFGKSPSPSLSIVRDINKVDSSSSLSDAGSVGPCKAEDFKPALSMDSNIARGQGPTLMSPGSVGRSGDEFKASLQEARRMRDQANEPVEILESDSAIEEEARALIAAIKARRKSANEHTETDEITGADIQRENGSPPSARRMDVGASCVWEDSWTGPSPELMEQMQRNTQGGAMNVAKTLEELKIRSEERLQELSYLGCFLEACKIQQAIYKEQVCLNDGITSPTPHP